MNWQFIFWLLFAYLYGSISNAVVVSNILHKKDVRDYGSKNAGSTNTLRTFGFSAAAIVFILDLTKPIIPIVLGLWLTPAAFDTVIGGVAWVGAAAIVGQCYPLFFHFKGGKGAASTVGVMISLLPLTVPFVAFCFFTLIFTVNIVSLATIVTFSLNIIFVYFLYPQYLIPYIFIVALVVWRHRPNIERLRNGTEPRIRDSMKQQKEKRS